MTTTPLTSKALIFTSPFLSQKNSVVSAICTKLSVGGVERPFLVRVILIKNSEAVPTAQLGISESNQAISPVFFIPFVPSIGVNVPQVPTPVEYSKVGFIFWLATIARINSISSNFARFPIVTVSLSATNI